MRTPETLSPQPRAAILHGAGYTGRELIRLLSAHPGLQLTAVTSASQNGMPVWETHPNLRGVTPLVFSDPADLGPIIATDVVLVAAQHGRAAGTILDLRKAGYTGKVVDLSADFRFKDASIYPKLFGFEHPDPSVLPEAVYGLPELTAPYPAGTNLVANPGCFATGIALALAPVASRLETCTAAITAMTGASGSGFRPSVGTHYPDRDGNVRAYKVFRHQHVPEVTALFGSRVSVRFVPVSGPWTRGIWGTIHIQLPDIVEPEEVSSWFKASYAHAPFVRLWEKTMPELRFVVGTPFCDIGWKVESRDLLIVFSLDNLLKGAASQAVQNVNLLLDIPQESGLTDWSSPIPSKPSETDDTSSIA